MQRTLRPPCFACGLVPLIAKSLGTPVNRNVEPRVTQFRLASSPLAALIVATLVLPSCSAPSPSPMRVEPRLTSLVAPIQSDRSCLYLDGGSIGIAVTDARGRTECFALPSHLGDPDRGEYLQAYVGALDDRGPGAVPVQHPHDTKLALVAVLRAASPRTLEDDINLAALTRAPRDIARVLVRRYLPREELTP
jgi:hypothetical protein